MIKKLFTFLLLFSTFTSFGQRVIWEAKFFNNSTSEVVTEQTPIMEGDTLRVEFHFRVIDATKYQNLDSDDTRYFFGDFQYNNDAFTRVPDAYAFPGIDNLGDNSPITATYFYDNYFFQTGRPHDALQNRYNDWTETGTQYITDDQWSVVRTTFQLSNKEVVDLIDANTLETSIPFFDILFTVNQNAHQQDITDLKFFMAMGVLQDAAGNNITDFDPGHGEDGYVMDLVDDAGDNVIVKVHLPETLDPTNFNVYVDSQTGGNNSFNGTLDINGEFVINDIPYADDYYVSISPIDNSYVPDIHTVTDAYRSFLGITDVGINGTERQFDVFETFIADVNMDDILDSRDVYWLLAYVTGILTEEEINTGLCLPSSTTAEDGAITWNWGCYTLVNYENYTEELLGTSMENWTATFSPTLEGNNYFEFAHWNHSDTDFSHTTPYPAQTQTAPARQGLAHREPIAGTLAHTAVGTVNIDMVADIRDDGKVEVTLKLNDGDLAGLQSRIKYDRSVLELEEVKFDTGNTLTNFSSHNINNVIFGTISPNGNEQVKEGDIVKLVFEPLEQINNITGLFYFYNTDAVKLNGDKLILNIQ
jgi:hypothetical protein